MIPPPARRRSLLRIHRLMFVLVVGVVLVAIFVVRGRERVAGRQRIVVPAAAPVPPPTPTRSRAPAVGVAPLADEDDAEEREVRVIDALVGKGDIGRARANAEDFLERHPTGARAAHVERLTGVHPHGPTGE